MQHFTKQDYQAAAIEFFEANPDLAKKYMHPQLLATVVEWMKESLPSVTAARIAFNRLVEEGVLERTDGQTDEDDMRLEVMKAQVDLEQAIADANKAPLTKAEVEEFASLSQRELSKRYWDADGYNVFAVRYRKACREYFFQEPAREWSH